MSLVYFVILLLLLKSLLSLAVNLIFGFSLATEDLAVAFRRHFLFDAIDFRNWEGFLIVTTHSHGSERREEK